MTLKMAITLLIIFGVAAAAQFTLKRQKVLDRRLTKSLIRLTWYVIIIIAAFAISLLLVAP